MAITLLLGGFARADKLDDLGLDREGKPKVESADERGPAVFLQSQRGLVPVERSAAELKKATDERGQAIRIAEWVIRGAAGGEKTEGLISAFPEGSRLLDVQAEAEGRLVICAELPEAFLADSAQVETQFELIHSALQKSIFLQMPEVRSARLLVRDPASGDYVSLDRFLPPDNYEPVVPIPDDATAPLIEASEPGAKTMNQPVRTGSGRASGALSGKAVYLNPGHGYVYRPTSESWGVQRGFVQNNIEDFSNVDTVNQWLFAYCYNAGADVFSVREEDQNFNMVIVDNDDGGPNYVETGSGWSTSSLAGFANGHTPYVDGQDPFSYGTNRLLTCTVGTPTASASWIPTIPETGWYNVYVSHAAYTNRSPQAHYRVYHAGGETDYYLDQRMRRFTWIFIGAYYFDEGRNPESGKVVLFNDSTSSTHYVSADAVRFGGGIGLVSRGNAGTSGRVRCDEDARYHLQFNGAPTSVYDPSTSTDNQMDERDGWSGRPRFGRWLKEQAQAYGASAQDSVFISSHTNAGGGTGLGTFIYTGESGTWHDDFRNAVHDEVLNDLARGYRRAFINHGPGKKEGTYGENYPGTVGNLMPIFLGEWLFHDSATDMAMYHDPKFRQMMARAIYQGIVKFWAARNGTAVNLLPEPPRNFRCRATGQNQVQIDWVAPETDAQGIRGNAATGYKIYRSLHGKGFPSGLQIGNVTTYTMTGLEPGTVYYFKMSATNAGGESFRRKYWRSKRLRRGARINSCSSAGSTNWTPRPGSESATAATCSTGRTSTG
jgi:N-acetylmuramoyl-L-alanine amidase